MASIKVKFRPSCTADREGTIYYLIAHGHQTRQLRTNYRIFPEEWDMRRSTVTAGRESDRRELILALREEIRHDLDRLTRLDRRLREKDPEYAPDVLLEEFSRYVHDYSLSNYMEKVIAQLKRNGKVRTSETYRAALNSFKKFLASHSPEGEFGETNDLMIDGLTSEIIEAYEAWQRGCDLKANTTSFYMRILRAVYNRAAENGAFENRQPFRHVYTGVDKTIKRAVPLAVIRKIKSLDLSAAPRLDFARDMFIMSFYLRGMSFIDMAFLRKSDLCNGYVRYRRRKTGQLLVIEWTNEMQRILNKYPANESDYLLPVITKPGMNDRRTYLNASYNINRNLKTVARMAGSPMPLTLYVARHSWASAARAKGIPVSVISEGMGHNSEMTTQIYLASLDTSIVDKANSLILKCLR